MAAPWYSEGATHAIVVTGAGKQAVDLLDGSLRTAEPELQHAAHWRGQIVLVEQTLDGAAVELAQHLQPLRLQPLQQPGDLIDPGDGAACELGELGVDLGCRGLCYPTRSFGKWPIDVKAALVDPAVEHPHRLFCRRQRGQPVIQLAQYFAVLHAVFAEPLAAARRSSYQ